MYGLVEGGRGWRALPLSQPGLIGIAHDLKQPCASIIAAETATKSGRVQERFLHHVLGVLVIASQPTRQVIGGVQMPQDVILKISGPVLFEH